MWIKNNQINSQEVKHRSEQIILSAGGEILDWLPTIDVAEPRTLNEVINRALVLNAMLQLHMNAPKHYIAHWIEENSLLHALTPTESAILNSQESLTDEEHYELYWSLESLWAIAWATNLIADLPFNREVGSELAMLSPNLQLNENRSKYETIMRLRSIEEIYTMMDLYYRLHWWVNNAVRINKSTGEVRFEVIKERRKALEWILDRHTVWDQMDLSL